MRSTPKKLVSPSRTHDLDEPATSRSPTDNTLSVHLIIKSVAAPRGIDVDVSNVSTLFQVASPHRRAAGYRTASRTDPQRHARLVGADSAAAYDRPTKLDQLIARRDHRFGKQIGRRD